MGCLLSTGVITGKKIARQKRVASLQRIAANSMHGRLSLVGQWVTGSVVEQLR